MPTGFKWSELQNDNTTEANSSGGITATKGTFSLADDFVVPVGQTWNISRFSFFAYQTGTTGNPFDELFIKVYNGPPNAGGTLIFGDFVTNRVSGVFDSKIYRIFNSSVPSPGTAPGTTRLIWKLAADVSLNLSAGTYWVEWTIKAINNGAIFCPSSTAIGQRLPWSPPVANAIQQTISTSTWATIADAGNPATAPDVNVEFPFEVEYTTTCPNTVNVNNSINFNDIKAQTTITTAFNISNTIPISANVVFQAGNSITLNPGFKTINNSTFTAKILGSCL